MKKRLIVTVMIVMALVGWVAMPTADAAALAANRDTPELGPSYVYLTQASNIIYGGSMVVVNSSGKAVAASDATGVDMVGRAEVYSDNSGANYLATRTIKVKRGIFRWANGSSITDAQIGDLAYVSDDQTVTTDATSYYIIAGVIVKVDSDGVWVDTKDIGSQGAVTPSSLAVSGAATVGTTLGVTGASSLGALTTTGTTTLGGTTVSITNKASVAGTLKSVGAVTADSTANIAGAVTMSNALSVATSVSCPLFQFSGSTNCLRVLNGTNLVWVLGTVTNDLDADGSN